MIRLLSSVFNLVFDVIGAAWDIAWGAVGLVFDILGGLFSLFLGMGILGLLIALLLVVRHVKRPQRESAQPEESPETRFYDLDGEEFTSFYQQKKGE